MFFAGLGTAVPPNRFTQRECWEAFQAAPQFARLEPRARAILKKILRGTNGIETRHAAVSALAEVFEVSPDILQRRFATHAPAVAAEAARSALADARLQAGEVDALIVSTCTGYLCPGLTSYVSERLGLRSDALLLDLVGQGCGAAIPNLRTAEALLAGGRAARVLSVCVEICSAAFYLDEDPGVLISACLFGDGAAAAVLTRDEPADRRRVKWLGAETTLSAVERDLLRFEQRAGMLRNVLSPEVPLLAAKHARKVFEAAVTRVGIAPERITGWVLHGGGRDVLAALREEFALSEAQVGHCAAVLREFGNLSSPFVLFALKRALESGAPGGVWWLASFGAGFSSHGVLLEVGDLAR